MQDNENNNQLDQENEAKHNLTGFFKLLLDIDMRINPKLYENNRNTNHPNKSE
jgi:hypothetical protein